MSEKPMTLNEAQKVAHRLVRERKALEFMAGVIDTAVWADDTRKNAERAVEDAQDQVHVLEGRKAQLQTENLALEAAQGDLKRHGKELSETTIVYEKTIEVRMAALDGEYEEKAEKLDERAEVLRRQKDSLEQTVAALTAEKAHIESVVEAFRKANMESD